MNPTIVALWPIEPKGLRFFTSKNVTYEQISGEYMSAIPLNIFSFSLSSVNSLLKSNGSCTGNVYSFLPEVDAAKELAKIEEEANTYRLSINVVKEEIRTGELPFRDMTVTFIKRGFSG